MAENELSVFAHRLKEHIPNDEVLAIEVKALIDERNNNQAKVDWQIRIEDAHINKKSRVNDT